MRYTSKQYATALYELTEGRNSKEQSAAIKLFTRTLARHNRLSLFREIALDYEKYMREKKGVIQVELTGTKDALSKKTEGAFGKKVEIKTSEDKNIIAGIRIRIKDREVDNTLRFRLNQLRKAIA